MALFKKSVPNHQQGITGLTKPAPIPAAAQRAQSGGRNRKLAIVIPALAFVAVGSLAFVALQKIPAPQTPAKIYSSAPPSGSAALFMNALKVPHEREKEIARQALLNDEVGPMEIKPLNDVVALTQPDRVYNEDASAAVTPVNVENVELVTAQVQPVPADTEEPQIAIASIEPEIVAPPVTTQDIAVVDCFDEVRELSNKSTIFFGSGSSEIDTNATRMLRVLGERVESCSSVLVHVTGHSDSVGSEQANLAMSWKRADQTIASLASLGIDTSHFEPVGFGARSPLAEGDSGDDALNRRVEFRALRKNPENP